MRPGQLHISRIGPISPIRDAARGSFLLTLPNDGKPHNRGQPARRSLPEFLTTGRSREDEDDDEDENELLTANCEPRTVNREL